MDAYPLPRIDDIVTKISKYEIFSTIDLRSAYHQVPIAESERKFTAFEACGNLFQFKRIPFGVTNGVASFQRIIDEIIRLENLKGTYAYLDDITIGGCDETEHDENLKRFMAVAEKYNLTLNYDKCKFSLHSVNLLGYNIENKTIKPDPERLRPLRELPLPSDKQSLRRVLGFFSHYSKWIPQFSKKVHPLNCTTIFPLNEAARSAFYSIKKELEKACVSAIDDKAIFSVETDASDFAIGATLSQAGRPIAFFSRTLTESERKHSAVEKEAYSIVESLRKWRHFLIGRVFRLVTDQKSVAFMFNSSHKGKIKNEKIMRWRLELSCYKYDIIYRPGRENSAADALSRVCSVTSNSLEKLRMHHEKLCHPGVTRMYHFVKVHNLPYSLDEIKRMVSSCQTCCHWKPQYTHCIGKLIKATAPFERLNVDFKGPLPTNTRNRYILTIVDEYSRFPFAYPCSEMTSSIIIKHFKHLFSVFGIPSYIHSDRGASFMSKELKEFLTSLGTATSHSTPYNPQGNGQVERYNGIIWKHVQLALASQKLDSSQWEEVLDQALNSIRSLLCTSTNATPHERMYIHQRRTFLGESMPSWLTCPGTVLLKRLVRTNKYEPLVDEVQLIEANPLYSHVRLQDGRETTVSNRHLAPLGNKTSEDTEISDRDPDVGMEQESDTQAVEQIPNVPITHNSPESSTTRETEPRRSSRSRRPPNHLSDFVLK